MVTTRLLFRQIRSQCSSTRHLKRAQPQTRCVQKDRFYFQPIVFFQRVLTYVFYITTKTKINKAGMPSFLCIIIVLFDLKKLGLLCPYQLKCMAHLTFRYLSSNSLAIIIIIITLSYSTFQNKGTKCFT